MLRAVIALFIIAACVLIGYHLTSRLSERQRILSAFITLFDTAASRMRYTGDELSSVFSDSFTGYSFVRDRAFGDQWLDMIGQYRGVLKESDLAVIKEFADGIGASDLESQLRHIVYYQALLTERLTDAKKDMENKASLYRVLPFSAGLTLAVLLL